MTQPTYTDFAVSDEEVGFILTAIRQNKASGFTNGEPAFPNVLDAERYTAVEAEIQRRAQVSGASVTVALTPSAAQDEVAAQNQIDQGQAALAQAEASQT